MAFRFAITRHARQWLKHRFTGTSNLINFCFIRSSFFYFGFTSRISYFTISKSHKHVFAFLFQNSNTNLLECHAFDCKTKCNVRFLSSHFAFAEGNYLLTFFISKAKMILKASFISFELAYEKYYNEKADKSEILLQNVNMFSANFKTNRSKGWDIPV